MWVVLTKWIVFEYSFVYFWVEGGYEKSMVFIPFSEILGGSGEPLVGSGFVPFILKGDEYAEEPTFLVASCEI